MGSEVRIGCWDPVEVQLLCRSPRAQGTQLGTCHVLIMAFCLALKASSFQTQEALRRGSDVGESEKSPMGYCNSISLKWGWLEACFNYPNHMDPMCDKTASSRNVSCTITLSESNPAGSHSAWKLNCIYIQWRLWRQESCKTPKRRMNYNWEDYSHVRHSEIRTAAVLD